MRKLITIFIVLALIIGLGVSSAGIYTDWLWFKDVGYEGVFWKRLISEMGLTAIAFVSFFALIFFNLRLLKNNMLKRPLVENQDNVKAFPRAINYLALFDGLLQSRLLAWAELALSAVLALIFSNGFRNFWLDGQFYLHSTDFDLADPIFNKDVSYYLFKLPFLESAYLSLFSMILLLTIFIGLIYGLYGLLTTKTRAGQAAVAHASGLLAVALLIWAFGTKLTIDKLVYSPRGVAFGASYTDMYASLPIYRFTIGLLLVLALGAMSNIFIRRARYTIRLPAAILVITMAAGAIYPFFLERISVEPNQLERETPYIEHNIKYTRIGFNIDGIVERHLSAPGPLTEETLIDNAATVENIRLLDWRLLNQTYTQLQGIRPYYRFGDIDIDRYEIDGRLQQVMLGARELSLAELQGDIRTWLNEHLVYTHGYGAVISPVTRVTAQGQPEFLVGDIPPRTEHPELALEQPRIYFGEMTNTYAVVNTDTKEFDYPKYNAGSDDSNATTTYQGAQGVPLTFFNKLMLSLRFGTAKLFLADSINEDSRILYNRNIVDRLQLIAPWFRYEDDPYAVVADGRIFWIIDGYTESTHFPYSEPLAPGGANYVRNSVKVTVDAYHGTVNFYLVDETDPVAITISKIFPDLLKPLGQMPASLRAHLRYPESFLVLQANVLGIYHIQNAGLFYNKEDLWSVALEKFENDVRPMPPYYTVMKLPGEEQLGEEFVLVLPITPGGSGGSEKHNMIAWLAARSDGEHYGELNLYHFPKDQVVQGPRQIDARIDQDTEISANLTLWSRADGSDVVRGNLLVIPVGDTILYVEPVYILAAGNDLPELKRVIVATRDEIAMRPTLREGLAAILGHDFSGDSEPPTTDEEHTGNLETLVAELERAFATAKEAQRSGNWAEYGRQQSRLEQLIVELQQFLDI